MSDLYNQLMSTVKDEDAAFIADNYAVILRAALQAKTAPEIIRREKLNAV